MALTKAQVTEILSAAGVDSEHMGTAVNKIMDGHVSSINALREEVAQYKADADKLPDLQKELEVYKAKDGEGWEQKAKDFEQKYNELLADNQHKETHAAKEAAYRELLKAAGISEKRIDAVLRVSDVDGVELVDGKIKGADKLTESVKNEWGDFIVTTTTKGADTPNPPANDAGKAAFDAMPLSEKMKFANEHPKEYTNYTK
jgi:Skp family chaperone for outer membrane proteins